MKPMLHSLSSKTKELIGDLAQVRELRSQRVMIKNFIIIYFLYIHIDTLLNS